MENFPIFCDKRFLKGKSNQILMQIRNCHCILKTRKALSKKEWSWLNEF